MGTADRPGALQAGDRSDCVAVSGCRRAVPQLRYSQKRRLLAGDAA